MVNYLFSKDTYANWTASNPILLNGEEALEVDTGRRKVGDGATAYNALPYEVPRSEMPAYAPNTAGNPFDQILSVYNAKQVNSRLLRTGLARVLMGGDCHLVVIGDSQCEYPGPDDAPGRTVMWPYKMRDALGGLLGIPYTDGYIRLSPTDETKAYLIDDRVTFSGTGIGAGKTWINGNFNGTGQFVYTTVNGASITVKTTVPSDQVEVYVTNTTGAWSVSVDGGTPQTFTTNNGGGYRKMAFTGLDYSLHTVVLTNTAANGTTSYANGVFPRNSFGSLYVHNMGAYGSTAQQWASGGQYSMHDGMLTLFGDATGARFGGTPGTPRPGDLTGTYPDHVLCSLGPNDVGAGRTNAQIQTDLTTVRNKWSLSDFNLFAQLQGGLQTQAAWETYIAGLYTTADSLNCFLFDLYNMSGNQATSRANGDMSSDNLHPGRRWQYIQGRNVASGIGELTGMTGPVNNQIARWIQFTYPGSLSLFTGPFTWYNDTGKTLTITAVRASVGTAPTGAAVIVDVSKNGTTIFTTQANRPTIAVSTKTIKRTNMDIVAINDGDYITFDIDQIGSTVAGSDLTVQVFFLGS